MTRWPFLIALALNGCVPGPDCNMGGNLPQCLIKSGSFRPGNDNSYPEEKRGAPVTVDAFQMDAHEVTNDAFAAFVKATGYVTLAERGFADNPDVPKEQQVPGGAVFVMPAAGVQPGWRFIAGANWRHPDGPKSGVTDKGSDPVVQIAYADALAYARWKGRDLPTEAEWEWAASGGAAPAPPERVMLRGKPVGNNWDGVFPVQNTGDDGYLGRAPVASFASNANGLYDMTGNVWEWTKDAWHPDHASPSTDPNGHTIKGGSFLCARNFCARYRPEARQFAQVDLGTNHIGFRTVKRGATLAIKGPKK
jgi:formylglycine-generating enzyme